MIKIKNGYTISEFGNQMLKYLVLLILMVIVIVPLYVMVSAAFKAPPDYLTSSPFSLPHPIFLGNILKVFDKAKILLAYQNSMIITLSSVTVSILIGSMMTFAVSRFNFKLKPFVMVIFYGAMMVPMYTIEVSRFTVIKMMGLYNTLGAPIILYIGADMMILFIYKQYMDKIPISLDESAIVDGASYWQVYTRIIFPLVKPATLIVAIIRFVDITNDMYIPYIYIPSDRFRTMTTAIMLFAGQKSSSWPLLASAMLWVILPIIIVYFIFQKQIISGIAAGAVRE